MRPARREKQISKVCSISADVEVAFDPASCLARDSRPQPGIRQQALDCRRERNRITLPDDEPRLTILNGFGYAGDIGRDARGANSHGLEQYGRQAVAVTVIPDNAGGDAHRGASHVAQHLVPGAWPE
jgi:hypothetical protein